jgi:hypothetical protein
MGQIIAGGQSIATIAGVDDVYILINPPNAVQIPGNVTPFAAAVGTAPWGPLNSPQVIGSGQQLVNTFGLPTVATYDMPSDVLYGMLAQGANQVIGVRVSDGTDTAAVFKMTDSTGFATATLTVAGSFAAGVTLTAVIGGNTITYVTQASDVNVAGIAQSLSNAINGSIVVAGGASNFPIIQSTTVAGAVITIKAYVAGTAGNSITLTATGTGVTLTASSGTLLAGAAPGILATLTSKYTGSYPNTGTLTVSAGSASTSTSPTYRVTFAQPNQVPEVYDNIIAYATAGSGYSATTFAANVVNAINGTPQLNPSRPASSYVTAVAGASTQTPWLNNAYGPAVTGTDGSAFAGGPSTADAAQLGVNGSTKTGMYALTGQMQGGQFVLSGNTDLSNVAASAIAFANQENSHYVCSFPTGTSVASAITNKIAYGINAYQCTVLKDYVEITDSINSLSPRRMNPSAFLVGLMCVTSPEQSPANRRVAGITGTERTGYSVNQPYTSADLALLEQNGINLFSNPVPGGAYFGLRHNKNSFSADPTRMNIAYSTLTKYIAANLGSSGVLGQFVGQVQSKASNDPLREKVRAALSDFVSRLAQQGLLDPSSFVQCDLRNNPASAIAAGALRADLVLVYNAIVDRLIIGVTGGQTVSVTVNPTQTTANS